MEGTLSTLGNVACASKLHKKSETKSKYALPFAQEPTQPLRTSMQKYGKKRKQTVKLLSLQKKKKPWCKP